MEEIDYDPIVQIIWDDSMLGDEESYVYIAV